MYNIRVAVVYVVVVFTYAVVVVVAVGRVAWFESKCVYNVVGTIVVMVATTTTVAKMQ